jgi:hypothetical protein
LLELAASLSCNAARMPGISTGNCVRSVICNHRPETEA